MAKAEKKKDEKKEKVSMKENGKVLKFKGESKSTLKMDSVEMKKKSVAKKESKYETVFKGKISVKAKK